MTDMSLQGPTQIAAVTNCDDQRVCDMLLTLLRLMVDLEEELELVSTAHSDGVSFEVRAAVSDIGKLVGKGGRTARAIRTILAAAAAKHRRRYSLDIAQIGP